MSITLATGVLRMVGSLLATGVSPAAPGAPGLASSSDTGASNTDNITAVQTPTVSGTCVTDGDTIIIDVDASDAVPNGACVGGVYSITLTTSIPEGTHALTALASNGSGRSPPSATTSVTIDTTPPVVTITSGPSGTVTSTSATFTFTVSGGSAECSLDNGVSAPCASPTTYSSLSNGPHSFAVTGTDLAGNQDSTSQSWTVTNVPGSPMLDLTSDSGRSNVDGITNAATLSFIGTCVDGDAIRLYIDGVVTAGPVTCNGGYAFNVSGVAEGSRTVRATATRAGVESDPTAPLQIVVDRTVPPDPTITSPAAGAGGSTQTIGGLAEADAYVSVKEGTTLKCMALADMGGSWSCQAHFATSGGHIVTAVATDVAGNVGPASEPYQIDVDTIFSDGFDPIP